MHAAATLTSASQLSIEKLSAIKPDSIVDAALTESMKVVCEEYAKLGATDRIAKGPSLLVEIKRELAARFPPTHLRGQN